MEKEMGDRRRMRQWEGMTRKERQTEIFMSLIGALWIVDDADRDAAGSDRMDTVLKEKGYSFVRRDFAMMRDVYKKG